MKKSYRIQGHGYSRSMDKNEYDNFVSLSKQAQLDIVNNDLSPKNMKQAEEILKNIPNGDNGSGVRKEAGTAKTDDTAGDRKNNTKKSGDN